MQEDPVFFVFIGFQIFLVLIFFISVWRIYRKAGKPGWAAFVPIYNIFILLQIINRPAWWLLLLFIPAVNILISIIVAIDLAKAFGKSTIYGIVFLWALLYIGYIMLAFDDSKYVGVKRENPTPSGSNPPQTPNNPQLTQPSMNNNSPQPTPESTTAQKP